MVSARFSGVGEAVGALGISGDGLSTKGRTGGVVGWGGTEQLERVTKVSSVMSSRRYLLVFGCSIKDSV